MGCYVISQTMACQVLVESICALMSTPFCGCGPTAGRCIFSKHRLPLAHIQYRGFWDSVLKDSRVLSIYFDPMALPELLCCTSLSLDVRRFHVQQFRAVMWSGVFHAFLDARAMRQATWRHFRGPCSKSSSECASFGGHPKDVSSPAGSQWMLLSCTSNLGFGPSLFVKPVETCGHEPGTRLPIGAKTKPYPFQSRARTRTCVSTYVQTYTDRHTYIHTYIFAHIQVLIRSGFDSCRIYDPAFAISIQI